MCLWIAAAICSPRWADASNAKNRRAQAASPTRTPRAGAGTPAAAAHAATPRTAEALTTTRRSTADAIPAVGAPPPARTTSARQPKVAPRPVRAVKRQATRARTRIKQSLPRRTWNYLDHLFDVLTLHEQPRLGGRGRITEERPYFEIVANALGIDLGLTVSEINRVAGQGKVEFVHVIGADGVTQNFESVLWRREIGHGQRIELQGPAVNTLVGAPIGFRAFGLGMTADLFEPGQRRALSYTLEAKLTERAIAYWMPFWGPALAGALEEGGRHTVANLVAGAIPFVSAGLAVQSAFRAYRLFKTPRAGSSEKMLALGHVAADVVRVFFPLVGTMANVALVATSAGVSWVRVKAAKRRAEKEQRPWYEVVPRFERDF